MIFTSSSHSFNSNTFTALFRFVQVSFHYVSHGRNEKGESVNYLCSLRNYLVDSDAQNRNCYSGFDNHPLTCIGLYVTLDIVQ